MCRYSLSISMNTNDYALVSHPGICNHTKFIPKKQCRKIQCKIEVEINLVKKLLNAFARDTGMCLIIRWLNGLTYHMYLAKGNLFLFNQNHDWKQKRTKDVTYKSSIPKIREWLVYKRVPSYLLRSYLFKQICLSALNALTLKDFWVWPRLDCLCWTVHIASNLIYYATPQVMWMIKRVRTAWEGEQEVKATSICLCIHITSGHID